MAIKPKGKKVTGTKKKDKITWTGAKEWKKALTVKAGAGNDVINFKKSKYKNKLYGEAGNDKIYGGKKDDYINGGAGNDIIYGTAGANQLKGGAGNDKIFGGTGNDKIWGGKGKDTISAGKGTNIIYHAKGDGNDVIQNGGGTDTLTFTGVNSINDLKGKASGNDVVITASNGETVTLKDYLKGGHSTKYVQVGNTKVKTEEIRNKIVSGAETVDGTAWSDDIHATYAWANIYAGAGNDVIHVDGHNDFWNVYVGKGNDTVSVDFDNPEFRILFENGDGNNVLTGLDNNISSFGRIYLHSEDLWQTVDMGEELGDYGYLTGSLSGNDVILNMTGGETFTIKNAALLGTTAINAVRVEDDNFDFDRRLTDVFYMPERIINLDATVNDYSLDSLGKLLIAPDVNFNRDITINEGINDVLVKGQKTQSVYVYESDNEVWVYNTGAEDDNQNYNCIQLNAGDNNKVYSGGGHGSYVNIDADNSTGNDIYIRSGDHNTVSTSVGGETYVAVSGSYDDSYNRVDLYGNDDLVLGKGMHDVYLHHNSYKYIDITSNASSTDVYGLNSVSSTFISQTVTVNPDDIMYEYYGTQLYNLNDNTYRSFVTVRFFDVSGNIINNNKNLLYLNGSIGEGFVLDNAAVANDISVEAWKDSTHKLTKTLKEMTQYVDMSNISYQDYTLGEHILTIADSVYIKGTTNNDSYSTDCAMGDLNRKYIIDDSGNNDNLTINQNRSTIRFFFDVNRSGKVVGSDLYIITGDSSEVNDFNAFVTNKGVLAAGDEDCIIIKNFFNPNGTNNVNYGTGYIEYIGDSSCYSATDQLFNNIAQQVAGWLSENTSYTSVSDMFNSNISTGDTKLYDLAYSYARNWSASGNWVNL